MWPASFRSGCRDICRRIKAQLDARLKLDKNRENNKNDRRAVNGRLIAGYEREKEKEKEL